MQITLLGFYFTIIVILFLFAYGGYENTMRLFSYLDLHLRFSIIRVRMYFIKRKLRRELNLSKLYTFKIQKELNNDRK
jgi:hypothetical protein